MSNQNTPLAIQHLDGASGQDTASFAEIVRNVANSDSESHEASVPQSPAAPPALVRAGKQSSAKVASAVLTESGGWKTGAFPQATSHTAKVPPAKSSEVLPTPAQGKRTQGSKDLTPADDGAVSLAKNFERHLVTRVANTHDLQLHIVVAPSPVPQVSPEFLALLRLPLGAGSAGDEGGTAVKSGNAKAEQVQPQEQQVLQNNVALEVRIRFNGETPVGTEAADNSIGKPSTAPISAPPKEPRLPQKETVQAGKPDESAVPPGEAPHKLGLDENSGPIPLRVPHAAMASETLAPLVSEITRSPTALPPSVAANEGAKSEAPVSAPPERREPPPPSAVANHEVPPERAEIAQPLRSVSLEFTPDGGSDIRLRVQERSGEVHISLHSSDPSLSGRLHEGIHDLVGSLSSAGYDAEAWTPNQGRQNQGQPEDSPKKKRGDGSGQGTEDFSRIFQHPVQEVI